MFHQKPYPLGYASTPKRTSWFGHVLMQKWLARQA